MMSRIALAGASLFWLGCGVASEAPKVDLEVVVDDVGVAAFETNLGYRVELSGARVAVADLVFTVAGEVHTVALWQRASDMLIPTAYAHPGHSQGGEVTGELPGGFVIDWANEGDRSLGTGTLIAGSYTAANFVLSSGTEELGVMPQDPLYGHTALIEGTAIKGQDTVNFTVVIDSPEGRELIGVPFEAEITASSTGTIGFRLEALDPIELDSLFADIDFVALDDDLDGNVVIEPDVAAVEDAYNEIRRKLQTHDHFRFVYTE